MTCQDCELALAGEGHLDEIEGHLAECAKCREFAMVLRENSEVFAAFREEAMPSVARRHARRWPLAAAAAAIAAMFILMMVHPKSQAPPDETAAAIVMNVVPQVSVVPGVKPVKRRAPKQPAKKAQPQILQVKMLTDDPDVVIYWQIEN